MNKFIHFLRKKQLLSLYFILFAASGILLFQANNGFEDNPNVDQPPAALIRDAVFPRPPQPMLVTTINGYDNWFLGTDLQEPHMSVSPTNPAGFVNGWNINKIYYSADGDNWGSLVPPVGGSSGDPWTACDSLGNFYYQTMKSPITGTWTIKSTNGGQTWGTAVSGVNGGDRNTMTIDQTAGPYGGYIYEAMTSTAFTSANFARSTDGGLTFTQTFEATPHNLPGVCIAVGPNGNTQGGCVYLVTYSGANSNGSYNFFLSTDGGANFNYQSSINGIGCVGIEISSRSTVNGARTRQYPWIAADNSYGPNRGRLYLVYATNNPFGSGNFADVYLCYSTDKGATWSSPIMVNDNANPTATHQWFPSMMCEKTTGKVWINWYDMRNDPNNQLVDVYATYSTNGGQSFAPNQRVTNQSWTYPGGGCTAPCYKGDYHMIAGNPTTSLSAWFDGRNGGSAGSYVGYFPDFALTLSPNIHSIGSQNDSDISYISVPSVKLYTDKAKFTYTITPAPATGSINVAFLNRATNAAQDSLTSYPDSLKVKITTSGGVASGVYTVTVRGKGSNGTPVHTRTITLTVVPIGIINNHTGIPSSFYLFQNYPNPFNPSTTIRFDMPKSGVVKLNVYDITGRLVSQLLNESYEAGSYNYEYDASALASGIYFYKLETPEFTSIKKMMLVK